MRQENEELQVCLPLLMKAGKKWDDYPPVFYDSTISKIMRPRTIRIRTLFA